MASSVLHNVSNSTSSLSNLNDLNLSMQLQTVPAFASLSATLSASRDGQLMMMLFAQELDRKMAQGMQESERRSNASLMQTIAFIANSK